MNGLRFITVVILVLANLNLLVSAQKANATDVKVDYLTQLKKVEIYILEAEHLDQEHPLPKKHVSRLQSILNQPVFEYTQYAVSLVGQAGGALITEKELTSLAVQRLKELLKNGTLNKNTFIDELKTISNKDAILTLFSMLDDPDQADKKMIMDALYASELQDLYPYPEPLPNDLINKMLPYAQSKNRSISDAAIRVLVTIPKIPNSQPIYDIITECTLSQNEIATSCLEVLERWNEPQNQYGVISNPEAKEVFKELNPMLCKMSKLSGNWFVSYVEVERSEKISKKELVDLAKCINDPSGSKGKYDMLLSDKKPECMKTRQHIYQYVVNDILNKDVEAATAVQALVCYYPHDELSQPLLQLLQIDDEIIQEATILVLYLNPDISRDKSIRVVLDILYEKVIDPKMRSLVNLILSNQN
jgi:hypothetical protein